MCSPGMQDRSGEAHGGHGMTIVKPSSRAPGLEVRPSAAAASPASGDASETVGAASSPASGAPRAGPAPAAPPAPAAGSPPPLPSVEPPPTLEPAPTPVFGPPFRRVSPPSERQPPANWAASDNDQTASLHAFTARRFQDPSSAIRRLRSRKSSLNHRRSRTTTGAPAVTVEILAGRICVGGSDP
jgi:hypothetical protein